MSSTVASGFGIPVSVVINSLYRQIIFTKGIPFPLTIPDMPMTIYSISNNELSAKLQHSYEQALGGQGRPFSEVFDDIERSLK